MRKSVLAALVALALVAPAGAAPPDPGLISIYRDSFGTPHIVAGSAEALAYGAGYMVARDRLFVTDVIRRLGQGRLSEILGPSMLAADKIARREFYDRADIARQVSLLPSHIRRSLQAYADGFNTALAEQQANPVEQSAMFAALGYEPEPWTIEDSAVVLMLFTIVTFAGEGAGGEAENAAVLADMIARHGEAEGLRYWEDLTFRNDPDAPAVVPAGEEPSPAPYVSASEPALAQLQLATLASLPDVARAEAEMMKTLRSLTETLPVPRIGSYALAATGERTASGSGLLLGAPQAGWSVPSIFYELGMHAPGIDCTGFTVPGLGPYIGIGWCNDHAWTLVAGNAGDQVDLYVETLCDGGYRFNGECVPFGERTEVYRWSPNGGYQGPPGVEVQTILSTVHGPVFQLDEANGVAYVFKRAQAGRFVETFLGTHAFNASRSFDEFDEDIRNVTATYNLLYADVEGNIAYRFTGFQPMRALGFDHRLPMPGTGEAEWQGMIPYEQMPHVTNPEGGILHVNQGIDTKPISWWPRASDVYVGRYGHTGADQKYFEDADALTIESLKVANREIIGDRDIVTPRLEEVIEDALEDEGGRLGEAYAIFESWRDAGYPRVDADNDGFIDHPGMTIFAADSLNSPRSPVWQNWMDRVWAEAGRGPRGPYVGRVGQTLAAVEDPHLFNHDFSGGASAKFRSALSAALGTLEAQFGTADMSRWRRPAPTISFSAIGLVTPRKMKVMDHGTYSQIVDLGLGRGVNILPPGNGRADRAADIGVGVTDPHFTDQLALYENWEFKPMKMRAADYLADAITVETLVYPGLLARG